METGIVERPWGYYEVLAEGQGALNIRTGDLNEEKFKIKRIFVNPGQSLSLQLHVHRTETWTILSGMARVTQGGWIRFLHPEQSVSIQKGEKHRLENIEDVPLEILEIQFGEYLGEDDIVRFEDKYGRT